MSDLTEVGLEAEEGATGQPQLPPTVDGMGWHVIVKDCQLDVDTRKQRSLMLTMQILSRGHWYEHIGDVRIFLDGRWPDTARRKANIFAHNLGIRGPIKDTSQFINRQAIVRTKRVENEPRYTRYDRSWPMEEEARIAAQPAQGWAGEPNIPPPQQQPQQAQQQQQPPPQQQRQSQEQSLPPGVLPPPMPSQNPEAFSRPIENAQPIQEQHPQGNLADVPF